MTIREKLTEMLVKMNYRQLKPWEAKTKKFLVFVHPNKDEKVFLGKAGAMRAGTTVANSVPVDTVKERMLKQWERDQQHSEQEKPE